MNLIVTGIVVCEVGFWVLLLGGLFTRYIARKQALSSVMLLGVPVLDVLLLSLIGYDILANGATADFTHGLGAVYLGFTVAFGPQLIARIDAWFHHRFAGGPQPVSPPRAGWGKVRYEWRQWLRLLLGAVIAVAVLAGLIMLADNPQQTAEFSQWILRVGLIVVVWLLGWPVWETVRYLLTRHRFLKPHPAHPTPPDQSTPPNQSSQTDQSSQPVQSLLRQVRQALDEWL